jgi:DNA-binding transcriptional ArsR family regulator
MSPLLYQLSYRPSWVDYPVSGGQTRPKSGQDTEEPSVSVDLPIMPTQLADGWTALGDPTRRTIFERVADHPQAVGDLARGLPVSRPAVSQHLRVLKGARLVVDRRAGTRRIYQLDAHGVGALRADLDQFWSKALVAYKAAVEQQTEESS